MLRFVRLLLFPFSLLYALVLRIRNYLFDTKRLASFQFSVPVIGVGNLSVGGTGKTPHIEYLVRLLENEYCLATLSRGYKRKSKGFVFADEHATARTIGDEPMQFYKKFPNLRVAVAEERIIGVPRLLNQFPDVDIILLDDAYQHRRIRPGFHILLTDYAQPFYKDYVLPAGNLRDNRSSAKRADCIVVSKCPENLGQAEAQEIRKVIKTYSDAKVYFSTLRYAAAYDLFTREQLSLENKNILIVSGIANPKPLQDHLMTQAVKTETLAYPDHYYFKASDVATIKNALQRFPAPEETYIVTTQKDATRLELLGDALKALHIKIAVVPVEVAFLFEEALAFNTSVGDYAAAALAYYRAGEA